MTKISAIINFHAEGLLAPASLASYFRCCAAAAASGFEVETIAILDRASAETAACVEVCRSRLSIVEHVDFGDLGESRNHAVRAASGDLIAFFDGDDLWGSDWLALAARSVAQLASGETIFHPEVVYYFDQADYPVQSADVTPSALARSFHLIHQDSASSMFDAGALLFNNVWTSNVVAARRTLLRHPLPRVDHQGGFGVEDWTWNVSTLAAGIRHAVVPGTVELVRVRDTPSLSQRNLQRRLIPPLHKFTAPILELARRSPLPAARSTREAETTCTAPPNDWPPPALTCAVAATPRSGSTLLSDWIRATRMLGRPAEYLNGNRGVDLSPAGIADTLRNVVAAGKTENGVFGIKLLADQFELLQDRIDWEDWFPNTKWIWLRRRDRLAQAVSLEIAHQSGAWTSRERVVRTPVYDEAAIRARLDRLDRFESVWEQHFARTGIRPLTLWYEDIVDARESVLGAISELVGVQASIAADTGDLARQASEINAEWIARFAQSFPDES